MVLIKAAILTLSDKGSRGERVDLSGPALASWLSERAVEVVCVKILPDEAGGISAQLIEWADSGICDLLLTTGGTGVSPRDVTPEATQKSFTGKFQALPKRCAPIASRRRPMQFCPAQSQGSADAR